MATAPRSIETFSDRVTVVPSRETEALVPNYYSTAVFTKEAYCDAVRAAYPDAKATDG